MSLWQRSRGAPPRTAVDLSLVIAYHQAGCSSLGLRQTSNASSPFGCLRPPREIDGRDERRAVAQHAKPCRRFSVSRAEAAAGDGKSARHHRSKGYNEQRQHRCRRPGGKRQKKATEQVDAEKYLKRR